MATFHFEFLRLDGSVVLSVYYTAGEDLALKLIFQFLTYMWSRLGNKHDRTFSSDLTEKFIDHQDSFVHAGLP
jgi:hypothetical protein